MMLLSSLLVTSVLYRRSVREDRRTPVRASCRSSEVPNPPGPMRNRALPVPKGGVEGPSTIWATAVVSPRGDVVVNVQSSIVAGFTTKTASTGLELADARIVMGVNVHRKAMATIAASPRQGRRGHGVRMKRYPPRSTAIDTCRATAVSKRGRIPSPPRSPFGGTPRGGTPTPHAAPSTLRARDWRGPYIIAPLSRAGPSPGRMSAGPAKGLIAPGSRFRAGPPDLGSDPGDGRGDGPARSRR